MSYTPINWQNGDVITAEKLNHMEDGIGGGILFVNGTIDEETNALVLDKTYQEIASADIAIVTLTDPDGAVSKDIVGYFCFDDQTNLYVISFSHLGELFASSPSDYPTSNPTSGGFTPDGGLTPVEPSPAGELPKG